MIKVSSYIFAGFLAFGAASCSPDVNQPQAAQGADAIECALDGATEFTADCLVERTQVGDQTILTVRQPDGGFQRFEQMSDGTGLVEADGAEVATRELEGDVLEVSVGGNRYRFEAHTQAADEPAE